MKVVKVLVPSFTFIATANTILECGANTRLGRSTYFFLWSRLHVGNKNNDQQWCFMQILILSDGKFGDRAVETIKQKYNDVSMVLVDAKDAREIIDEQAADLIISYIRHPDINLELAKMGKPLIIAIDLGQGLLQQAREINTGTFMPSTMCHLEPVTGIEAIDSFAEAYGLPRYELTLTAQGNRITSAKTVVESPCGATRRSLPLLAGAPLTPETLNAFAINIAQECRESVAYMMAKSDGTERATFNHLLPLLAALQQMQPELFRTGGALHDYLVDLQVRFERQGARDAVTKLLKR
jgi:hypothetical protein